MDAIDRPLPTVTPDSAPYWRSASEHALRLQRCDACGTFRFYPAPVCPACGGTGARWEEVGGGGAVYSVTVVHRPAGPAFADRVPMTLALVTLDEGPTMMATVSGAEPGGVAIGDRVRLDYEDVTADTTLPVFVLDRDAGEA